MRILRFCFITLFIFLLFSQNGQGYLKIQRREIANSNGQQILLRGFGLYGRLVKEGYQLHVPGFGSSSSIRKMIIDLIEHENEYQFYQYYICNYVTEEDIQKIASWGFNSIRLLFDYRLLTPEDFLYFYFPDKYRDYFQPSHSERTVI